MTPERRLALSTFALHGADQAALAALPLLATLHLGGGPGMTGALVAAQGAAWLLVSLPAGAWLDRAGRVRALRVALWAAALGFLLAWALRHHPATLALAAFLGSGAVVVGILAVAALLPGYVAAARRPRANAAIELARGVATLVAAPLAGLCAQLGSPGLALPLAAAFAVTGALALGRLPAEPPPAPRVPLRLAILEGARFTWREAHLRGLAFCAIAWNFAFFALLAVLVPLALGPLGLTPAETGLALGFYGAGLMMGAVAAPLVLRVLAPGHVLALGPGLTLLAVLLLWAGLLPAFPRLALSQWLVGFGPMLWQVTQTTLRQAVTPSALLGRVGAVMQVAVFGVRPLGALAGGALAARDGAEAGLLLALLGFALSVLLVLRAPLRGLSAFPTDCAAGAPAAHSTLGR
ncbi:MFS transporter [Roseococcus suduntuyensis]|uniref:MFS family permease n=1 Tax=Roseococcus suduntuyensis TaxID=455361 RepID=A0A840ACW0_9PROT|nr:MFS transporter [Roseococcus suduntuyensis]MBB3898981.1 MFS family permease [Roseococcus suduntuyensis]